MYDQFEKKVRSVLRNSRSEEDAIEKIQHMRLPGSDEYITYDEAILLIESLKFDDIMKSPKDKKKNTKKNMKI